MDLLSALTLDCTSDIDMLQKTSNEVLPKSTPESSWAVAHRRKERQIRVFIPLALSLQGCHRLTVPLPRVHFSVQSAVDFTHVSLLLSWPILETNAPKLAIFICHLCSI